MKILSIIIATLAILLTVKPFIRSANWFIRLGDFPRLQILILLIISMILQIVAFERASYFSYIFTLILLICLVYQAASILPFTIFVKKEVQDAREKDDDKTNISILIFNVLMENEKYAEVFEFVRKVDADVVLLAEPNQTWEKHLQKLNEIYPNVISHPLENHYGMMFFSKLEVHDSELQFLIQDDIPSIHTQIRLRSGDDIAFHGVHPRPPVPEEKGQSTERDGELLLVGKAVRESQLPCIVAGDLNDAAWSKSTKLFKRISGLLDPRIGRGFYNTFHAKYKFFRLPLDHVFHSNHFRLIELDRIKNACGSDHFPVYVKLSYEKSAAAQQPKWVASAAETEEAKELIGVAFNENRYKRLSLRNLKEKIAKYKDKISRKKR